MSEAAKSYEGWAIVELMGHRRLGGRVSQAEQFGAVMLRIDVPNADGAEATQFYGGGSIYCLTPTTEEIARAVAARNQPTPVSRWELPAPKHDGESQNRASVGVEDDDDDFDDRDDMDYDGRPPF